MEYKRQLEQPEWLLKREKILNRDSFKCIECLNISYQTTFNSGLIFGNTIEHKSGKSILHNDSFIVKIWDFKTNSIQTAFINSKGFNPDKSYIAFYDFSAKYANIVALKIISDTKVELSPNLIDIIKLGLKGKVTESTFNSVYEPISAKSDWSIVKGLHIHHTYYQTGKLAWQYDEAALQTLCWTCHEKLHAEKTIPIFDSLGNNIGTYTNCKRCYGAGYFPDFHHVYSGICFRCDGKRFEELIS